MPGRAFALASCVGARSLNLPSDDPESVARIAAFEQGLAELGWTIGRNVQVDHRLAGDPERFRRYSEELVALAPDVIVATGVAVRPLVQGAPHRVRECYRSGRQRPGREPGTARRQRHWFHDH